MAGREGYEDVSDGEVDRVCSSLPPKKTAGVEEAPPPKKKKRSKKRSESPPPTKRRKPKKPKRSGKAEAQEPEEKRVVAVSRRREPPAAEPMRVPSTRARPAAEAPVACVPPFLPTLGRTALRADFRNKHPLGDEYPGLYDSTTHSPVAVDVVDSRFRSRVHSGTVLPLTTTLELHAADIRVRPTAQARREGPLDAMAAVRGYQAVRTDEHTFLRAVFGSEEKFLAQTTADVCARLGVLFGRNDHSFYTLAHRAVVFSMLSGDAPDPDEPLPPPSPLPLAPAPEDDPCAQARAAARLEANRRVLYEVKPELRPNPLRSTQHFMEHYAKEMGAHPLHEDLERLDLNQNCGTRFHLQLVLLICAMYKAHVCQRFLVATPTNEGDSSPARPVELLAFDRREWECGDSSRLRELQRIHRYTPLAETDPDGHLVTPTPLAALAHELSIPDLTYFVLGRLLGIERAELVRTNTSLKISAQWADSVSFVVNPIKDERTLLAAIKAQHPEAQFRGENTLTTTQFVNRHPRWVRHTYQNIHDSYARLPYFLSHLIDFLREPLFTIHPPGARVQSEEDGVFMPMPTEEEAALTFLGQYMRLLHELAPLFPDHRGLDCIAKELTRPEHVRRLIAIDSGRTPPGIPTAQHLFPLGSRLRGDPKITPFSDEALHHYFEARFGARTSRLVAFTDHRSRFDAEPGPSASGGGSNKKAQASGAREPKRGAVSVIQYQLFFIPPASVARHSIVQHAWGPATIDPLDLLHYWGGVFEVPNPHGDYPPPPQSVLVAHPVFVEAIQAVRAALELGGDGDATAWETIGWPDELAAQFRRKPPLDHRPGDPDVDLWYAFVFFRLALSRQFPESILWAVLFVHRQAHHSRAPLPLLGLRLAFPAPTQLRDDFLRPLALGFERLSSLFQLFRNQLAYYTMFDPELEARNLARGSAGLVAVNNPELMRWGHQAAIQPAQCYTQLPLDDEKFQLGLAPEQYEANLAAFVDDMLQRVVRRPDAVRWFFAHQVRGVFSCAYPASLSEEMREPSWLGALLDHVRLVLANPARSLTLHPPESLRSSGAWPSVMTGKVRLRLALAEYVPPPEYCGPNAQRVDAADGALEESTASERNEHEEEEEEYVEGDEDIHPVLDSGVNTKGSRAAKRRRAAKRGAAPSASKRVKETPVLVALPAGPHLVVHTPDALALFFAIVMSRFVLPLKFYVEHICYAPQPMLITLSDGDRGPKRIVPYAEVVTLLLPKNRRKAPASLHLKPKTASSRRTTLATAVAVAPKHLESLLGSASMLADVWNSTDRLLALSVWTEAEHLEAVRLVHANEVLGPLFDLVAPTAPAFQAHLGPSVFEHQRKQYVEVYRARLRNVLARHHGFALTPDPVGTVAAQQVIAAAAEFKTATERMLAHADEFRAQHALRLTGFEARVRHECSEWLARLRVRSKKTKDGISDADADLATRELRSIDNMVFSALRTHERNPAESEWFATDYKSAVAKESFRLDHFRHLGLDFSSSERTAMAVLHAILQDESLLSPEGGPRSLAELDADGHPLAKLFAIWKYRREYPEIMCAAPDDPSDVPVEPDPVYPGRFVWAIQPHGNNTRPQWAWLAHFVAACCSVWAVAGVSGKHGDQVVSPHRATCAATPLAALCAPPARPLFLLPVPPPSLTDASASPSPFEDSLPRVGSEPLPSPSPSPDPFDTLPRASSAPTPSQTPADALPRAASAPLDLGSRVDQDFEFNNRLIDLFGMS